jgi:hypothetical protein
MVYVSMHVSQLTKATCGSSPTRRLNYSSCLQEYEEPTAFYATESTTLISEASEYLPFQGDFDHIRFPELTPSQVVEQASIVLNREQHQGLSLA